MDIINKCADIIVQVRRRKSLVHCITNYVTINDCANIILSAGGRAVMTDCPDEVEEITAVADALVINIGGFNADKRTAMQRACHVAKERGIPIIFDPVGVGGTTMRTQFARELLEQKIPTVIRGNVSEVLCLADGEVRSKGVDAGGTDVSADEIDKIRLFAAKNNCVVCATGAVDIITDGDNMLYVRNGHPMMGEVTGTGCMCSSLIGCAAAVTDSAYTAVVSAAVLWGIAGEKAYRYVSDNNCGTGTFKIKLFDYVYSINGEEFSRLAEVEHG